MAPDAGCPKTPARTRAPDARAGTAARRARRKGGPLALAAGDFQNIAMRFRIERKTHRPFLRISVGIAKTKKGPDHRLSDGPGPYERSLGCDSYDRFIVAMDSLVRFRPRRWPTRRSPRCPMPGYALRRSRLRRRPRGTAPAYG